jgi:hypothetical protein
MAFDPRDHDGETIEGNETERLRLMAQAANERDEAERIACAEADFYSALDPALTCDASDPIYAAVNGWRRAMSIASAMQEAA